MCIDIKKISKTFRWFINKTFPICQRIGFYITPNHFYKLIPNTRTLEDKLWSNYSELVDIDIGEESQINLPYQFHSKFKVKNEIFLKNKSLISYQYYVDNNTFESMDGKILYCMIRYFKPKKFIEIESGNSTYLAVQAVLKNKEEDGDECELIAIMLYPNNVLTIVFPGLSELILEEVQNPPILKFTELKENDILFINSSHVLKNGNDVQYNYYKTLLTYNKSVIVHIQDIFLPSEYLKEWILKEFKVWTEQYLLQTFLIFNIAFKNLWRMIYTLKTS